MKRDKRLVSLAPGASELGWNATDTIVALFFVSFFVVLAIAWFL